MFFARLLDTRSAMPLFVIAIFTAYAAIPRLVYYSALPDEYFIELSNLALVSCLAIWAGYSLPLFNSRFRPNARRISINANWFHGAGLDRLSAVSPDYVCHSAKHSDLVGNPGRQHLELDAQRGAFLKGRTGLEAVLPYLGALLVTAVLPYSLVHLFIERSRLRYLFLAIFLAFSVSFLVKSLFINAAFPLVYFIAQQRKLTISRMLSLAGLVFCLLYVVSMLALGDAASDWRRSWRSRPRGFFQNDIQHKRAS